MSRAINSRHPGSLEISINTDRPLVLIFLPFENYVYNKNILELITKATAGFLVGNRSMHDTGVHQTFTSTIDKLFSSLTQL